MIKRFHGKVAIVTGCSGGRSQVQVINCCTSGNLRKIVKSFAPLSFSRSSRAILAGLEASKSKNVDTFFGSIAVGAKFASFSGNVPGFLKACSHPASWGPSADEPPLFMQKAQVA